MPGSSLQRLKDVTPDIMNFEVLQVILMDSKVWEPLTERWKAIDKGQIIPTKSNSSKNNQSPKSPSQRPTLNNIWHRQMRAK